MADEQQAGTSTETETQGAQTGGASATSGPRVITQEDVNRTVSERLARQKETFEKKLAEAQQAAVDAWREERGLSDDALAKLGTVDEEKLALKRELAKARGDLTKLSATHESARAKLLGLMVDETIMKVAAPKAANGDPEPILAMLRGRMKVDESTWSAYVADEKGEPSGMSVDDLVSELLARKPQLAAATGHYGSGSSPARKPGGRPAEQSADTPESRMAMLSKVFGG
jgi:predicted metal-dependent hydrolase